MFEYEKQTYSALENTDLNFIGNVEPMDIVSGDVDVVVTDGFTGNIVIKVAEASASLCVKFLKESFQNSIISKFAGMLSKRYIKKSLENIDHRKYNGAMFVGVDGIVVKSHGSSDSTGFCNAIKVAYNLSKQDVNSQISKEIKKHQDKAHGLVDKIKKTFGL